MSYKLSLPRKLITIGLILLPYHNMKLLKRLTEQFVIKGEKDPEGLAKFILKKNGYMKEDGTLTLKGLQKQSKELF